MLGMPCASTAVLTSEPLPGQAPQCQQGPDVLIRVAPLGEGQGKAGHIPLGEKPPFQQREDNQERRGAELAQHAPPERLDVWCPGPAGRHGPGAHRLVPRCEALRQRDPAVGQAVRHRPALDRVDPQVGGGLKDVLGERAPVPHLHRQPRVANRP
jgi:hypothetical protein